MSIFRLTSISALIVSIIVNDNFFLHNMNFYVNSALHHVFLILLVMYRSNDKIVEDNKKHKRNSSFPIICVSDCSNETIASERISKKFNGIFSYKRFKTFSREDMAGTISDDPSIARMANGGVPKGQPIVLNGTDSELEGVSRQSSIRLTHHRNSEGHKSDINRNSIEPGMYIT